MRATTCSHFITYSLSTHNHQQLPVNWYCPFQNRYCCHYSNPEKTGSDLDDLSNYNSDLSSWPKSLNGQFISSSINTSTFISRYSLFSQASSHSTEKVRVTIIKHLGVSWLWSHQYFDPPGFKFSLQHSLSFLYTWPLFWAYQDLRWCGSCHVWQTVHNLSSFGGASRS